MKGSKKKYAVAIVAFIIFVGLFILGLKANKIYSNVITNKQIASQKEQAKSTNKINKDTKSKNSTNPSTVTSDGIVKVTAKDPKSKCTFQIIDTVHGNKMILAKDVDSSMEGQNVGYITERILDNAKINYRCTGSVSTIYFAAINGLEEKKAGKLSGWCYYMRKKGDNAFHKPNVGSGQWTWHSGDVIVWRYLADGIHDGYEGDWGKSSF
ncbi:DUF4430 domain-containing protein [Clostridium sp. AWRP]|nr:DUF4430 domain-containing protein [Clostridium sp. AWRP]